MAKTAVYVANTDDGEIAVYVLNDRNGDLRFVQKVKAGSSVAALTKSPNGRELYAALRQEPYSVVSFSIDRRTGKLKTLGSSPLPDNACYLSTDRRGKSLFMASYSGSKIAVNAIGRGGAVRAAQPQVVGTGRKAHAIDVDSSNRFVLVPNLGSDQIQQFLYNEKTGKLSPNTPPAMKTKAGAGPRHLVFAPNNELVYSINELDGTVNVYSFNAEKGTLQERQSISFLRENFSGKIWGAQIQLTPDGRHLYVSERTSSTIVGFEAERKTGMLKLLFSMPTEKQPRAISLTPKGDYLLVSGQVSGQLSVYGVAKRTGRLSYLRNYAVGNNPSWVETVPLNESP